KINSVLSTGGRDMLLTSKPFSLPGTSRGGSHHRPGAQLLKCPATPRLHEHHDKGEKGEHEHTVPAANGGQARGSVAPVPPPAVRAEASTSSPSHVRALISHWEAVTQGEASATAVSELVNAELEQTPKEGKAQPSLRALAMAASMGDAKRQSSKSSSRASGAVNRGSNTSMSAVPEASTEGDVPASPQDSLQYSRPVTALGKRQLLNHLQVLDSLNYAYSARSAELRAKKPRAPTTPEGIRAADWVLQVLGYKMDDQALEGWETRVLEGAARAGVPLEEVLGPEAANRYKARVPLEEVLGPGAVDGNKVALLERMPPTPRQPSLQRPSSPPSQPVSTHFWILGMGTMIPCQPVWPFLPLRLLLIHRGSPPCPSGLRHLMHQVHFNTVPRNAFYVFRFVICMRFDSVVVAPIMFA
ncbi:hypothetical protein DUNSADRAFT_10357, partial [Dunaliella salina]